jgi:hypothetical protein
MQCWPFTENVCPVKLTILGGCCICSFKLLHQAISLPRMDREFSSCFYFIRFFRTLFWDLISIDVCCREKNSGSQGLYIMVLYLLIWGEAANICFLPECLCYLFIMWVNSVEELVLCWPFISDLSHDLTLLRNSLLPLRCRGWIWDKIWETLLLYLSLIYLVVMCRWLMKCMIFWRSLRWRGLKRPI